VHHYAPSFTDRTGWRRRAWASPCRNAWVAPWCATASSGVSGRFSGGIGRSCRGDGTWCSTLAKEPPRSPIRFWNGNCCAFFPASRRRHRPGRSARTEVIAAGADSLLSNLSVARHSLIVPLLPIVFGLRVRSGGKVGRVGRYTDGGPAVVALPALGWPRLRSGSMRDGWGSRAERLNRKPFANGQ